MNKTNAYIIAMNDTCYNEGVVWFAKFDDQIGITPKRDNAFICDDSNVDEYVEKAQALANKMMTDAFLPVGYARKAEKVPVIILENEYKREII